MSWNPTDLATYGEGCLVEIIEQDEDGLYTVEVIECEDGSQSGTISGVSEEELSGLTDEDAELYE